LLLTFACRLDGGIMMNNLRYYREKHEMTQYQLSLLAGTSKSTISNIEKGKHSTNQTLIKNISKVLGERPCDIFDLGCEYDCNKFNCI
jgi:DNA-binding XRE family transcriptional regulator